MNPFDEVIGSTDTIAVSRLADEVDLTAIRSSGAATVEVLHVACRPIDEDIPPSLVRVRHWPNVGGYLEHGSANDIVAWAPYLAKKPSEGRVVPVGPPADGDLPERTRFFRRLVRRLEQHRGVAVAHDPRSARAIVYTPGVGGDLLGPLADRYPGAVAPVPDRLTEFPGGLMLTMTSEAWCDRDGYSESLDNTLSRSSDRIGLSGVRPW